MLVSKCMTNASVNVYRIYLKSLKIDNNLLFNENVNENHYAK
jgi:hypothetical protein